MFKNNYEILESLTFFFDINEFEKADIRIHDKQIFLLEDMLALILRISTEELLSMTVKNIVEGKININDHLRYYAWYGSSGGKLYKLIGDKVTLYKRNSEPTLEDDQLKLIFSHEAIDILMDDFNYNIKNQFFSYCDEVIRRANQYNSYLQFIVAGTDESISMLEFNSSYSTFIMSMPEHNIFLRENWNISDVFHYDTRFKKSILPEYKVVSLISSVRVGEIDDVKNKEGQIENNYIHELLFKQDVEELLHKFKLIRLVTTAPIYCTEIMTQFKYTFIGIPQYLQPPQITKTNEAIYKFNNINAELINSVFNEFSLPIDNEVLNLLLVNYDYSFYVPDDVAILILVSCLEIIYHPGDKDELKFRIARNATIFLGTNEEESTLLFDEIKKLYDIRSSLVHTGKFNLSKYRYSNKEEVIYRLKKIVSTSILKYKNEIVDNNVTKTEFFDQLNKSGFGDYPFNSYKVNLF
ncbi:HEPN domain-containing protein [Paenibacillus terrigena]|uniref:HEPN domain-containing protein n=1 Tax=Paenibacillus terrigena TaxID=369333 RepID=UPI00037262DB|nr:HEPN domain-containing protein [Paenibacillus terrigena]